MAYLVSVCLSRPGSGPGGVLWSGGSDGFPGERGWLLDSRPQGPIGPAQDIQTRGEIIKRTGRSAYIVCGVEGPSPEGARARGCVVPPDGCLQAFVVSLGRHVGRGWRACCHGGGLLPSSGRPHCVGCRV
jgi:hypothetical protein